MSKEIKQTIMETGASTALFVGIDSLVLKRPIDPYKIGTFAGSSLITDTVTEFLKPKIPENITNLVVGGFEPLTTGVIFTLAYHYALPRFGVLPNTSFLYSFLEAVGSQAGGQYAIGLIPK